MAIKYTHEELVFLRDSPLCTKPEHLPPAEEWMGPPVEQQLARAQHQQNRNVHGAHNGAFVMGHFEQSRGDKTLLDQTNRRPDMNRHASRNSATNPEDIVFGPPRMQFTSAGRKGGDNDRSGDGEHQSRLNNFRTRTGDGDGERFREGRNANPLRRRDGDQDNEGWSTVKPRKSFGAEGAERFQGRVGMSREDKRHSRETDRPARGFDSFNRDNEEEGRPRNGLRHKAEGSEGRIGGEKRERMDRAKSWRDKAEVETEDHPPNRYGNNNNNNRHWGRDGRAEREPEWLDEPAEPKAEVRTQKDFQKWMEEMKKSSGGGAPPATSKPTTAVSMPEAAPEGAKAPLRSPPADSGMDKFFAAFGAPPAASAPAEENKAKSGGKSSRFTSFFANQDTPKNDTTPKPPPVQAPAAPAPNSLLGALMAAPSGPQATQDEKQAFQNIIAKLKVQSMSATPPGSTPFAAPPNQQEGQQRTGPSPFQHEQDGQAGRPPPQHSQEIHAPRPQQQTARPDQLMQDLLGHHQRVSSQSSARNEGNPPNPSRSNSNTEFLMNLMRSPDAQRSDSAMMRAAQQAQKQGAMPPQPQEREGEFGDEGRGQPRMRGPPPGFGVNDAFRGEPDFGRGQPPPPHILQRPQGPPGLDQLPPGFMGGHMPPPQQQGQQPPRGGPMLPPPGLQGGRGLPPGMFPPGAPPPGPHMHPDMGNMPGPPRNMGMPPPGFFNGGPPPPGGPHGFMPPGMGGFNGPPGPDSPFSPGPHSGGPHSGGPFERGMPGTRGGNFGRG